MPLKKIQLGLFMSKEKSEFNEIALGVIIVLALIFYRSEDFISRFFMDETYESVIAKHETIRINTVKARDFIGGYKNASTKVQRDLFVRGHVGTLVQWVGVVDDIRKKRDYYVVDLQKSEVPTDILSGFREIGRWMAQSAMPSHLVDSVCGTVNLYPAGSLDDDYIAGLKKGSLFRYEAVISAIDDQGCVAAKFGVLSNSQINFNDENYTSKLKVEQVIAKKGREDIFANSLKKNGLSKGECKSPDEKGDYFLTNIGVMTIDEINPAQRYVKIGGVLISELTETMGCIETWKKNDGYQYRFFYAGDGGNSCDGPYIVLSTGEGVYHTAKIDTCDGSEEIYNSLIQGRLNLEKHNIRYVEDVNNSSVSDWDEDGKTLGCVWAKNASNKENVNGKNLTHSSLDIYDSYLGTRKIKSTASDGQVYWAVAKKGDFVKLKNVDNNLSVGWVRNDGLFYGALRNCNR